ncbi:MAG TPA: hypothetical protein VJX67_02255 [Blastocatellia bacterium]|nr:hypothetical protein [Blastocatellia bacterium]
MKKWRLFAFAVTLVMVAGLFASAAAQQAGEGGRHHIKKIIHPMNPTEADRMEPSSIGFSLPSGGTSTVNPPLTYNGGPLINTPVIYFIWYGNWNQSNGSDNPAGQQILRDFANSIGGSPYFQLNTTYNAGGFTISGNVTFGGEATDTGSQGTRLRDSSILAIVNRAINNHLLPYNANGVYFVLTSTNISETSGFCSFYCGWHTAGNASAGPVRYSFVGNANRCLNGCAAQTTGPNGNAGVDGMVSIVAHELEESTTDPNLDAWFDSQGAENGDKCAWTFGHSQFRTSNGAFANVTTAKRNFLIQRNIEITGSGDLCMMDSTHN